jgi:hypothetical protein
MATIQGQPEVSLNTAGSMFKPRLNLLAANCEIYIRCSSIGHQTFAQSKTSKELLAPPKNNNNYLWQRLQLGESARVEPAG